MPPRRPHYYGYNHLHYLTANVYRRARIFDSDRFKRQFVQTLGDLRAELGFRIVGYVLMPEHCHLLIWPSDLGNPSQIMQKLSERTANFMLRTLRRNLALPWTGLAQTSSCDVCDFRNASRAQCRKTRC